MKTIHFTLSHKTMNNSLLIMKCKRDSYSLLTLKSCIAVRDSVYMYKLSKTLFINCIPLNYIGLTVGQLGLGQFPAGNEKTI
jgi:hypothetical protein